MEENPSDGIRETGTTGIDRFEQLEVWQAAHALVLRAYQVTLSNPSDEKFGLIPQMRRAAVSVPANIAEGFKRRGRPDKAHFYTRAEASLEELHYYFILRRDLGYKLEYEAIARQADQVSRMLYGLIKSLKSQRPVCCMPYAVYCLPSTTCRLPISSRICRRRASDTGDWPKRSAL